MTLIDGHLNFNYMSIQFLEHCLSSSSAVFMVCINSSGACSCAFSRTCLRVEQGNNCIPY
ncbi:hypothetical protein BpHYR1_013255 [Brachionus plicatilis]|uniref:Uncharacterized protein n=1 Tax=Brachionus plicatilis TaxID=10195 RepID=A0A3M7S191_BRAPC|nr:hypothetical protein BpHYR1_013255 [Brachionus plicatilis]